MIVSAHRSLRGRYLPSGLCSDCAPLTRVFSWQVAELTSTIAEQHERCAVLGAEVQSLERQLEASKTELATANTALSAQAQALALASQQQSFLQEKLGTELQVCPGRRLFARLVLARADSWCVCV